MWMKYPAAQMSSRCNTQQRPLFAKSWAKPNCLFPIVQTWLNVFGIETNIDISIKLLFQDKCDCMSCLGKEVLRTKGIQIQEIRM